MYVKSSEEGILKVAVYVARSVSSVFDGNVISWTIWDTARDLDKVSEPRFVSARHRLSTDTTYTTRINRMNSMCHVVESRSIRYSCGLCCVRCRLHPKGLRELLPPSQNEIRDGGRKARSVGRTCFASQPCNARKELWLHCVLVLSCSRSYEIRRFEALCCVEARSPFA